MTRWWWTNVNSSRRPDDSVFPAGVSRLRLYRTDSSNRDRYFSPATTWSWSDPTAPPTEDPDEDSLESLIEHNTTQPNVPDVQIWRQYDVNMSGQQSFTTYKYFRIILVRRQVTSVDSHRRCYIPERQGVKQMIGLFLVVKFPRGTG